jgi:hypothetical protein
MLSDLIKLEFYQQIFEKKLNIKFQQNPSRGSRVVCGRTDGLSEARTNGHDEANSRFRNSAEAHKNDLRIM